jgi:chromosome segregation ATPase
VTTLKVNYEKEQSVLNDKIDNLNKTNEKLDYNFNKQKKRLNNVQTQLNSTRNANTKLNETITSLERRRRKQSRPSLFINGSPVFVLG